MSRFVIAFASFLFLSMDATAACKPPKGVTKEECNSCGNLEQNPTRGIELAWNALLKNRKMQQELSDKGLTLVALTNPWHSSRGVLFYIALIRDPSFEIVDTDSYSRMISLQRELDRGFRGSVDRGGPRGGAEVRWRSSLQIRIERARNKAIRTTTKPYEIELRDQNGRGFRNNVHKVPRNNGKFTPRVVGPRDLEPSDRYLERDCFDADPRFPRYARRGGGTGAGGSGRDDAPRGRGSCDITEKYRCRSDFSNPRGSGTICNFDVTISCA